MYYYIFEQAKNNSFSRKLEAVKNIVISLGIAGETVQVSPARTVTELVNMGIAKEYSTIVAVGSDRLVNQIASIIHETNFVLGIIPIDASEKVTNIIGTADMREACENLKHRKLDIVDLGMIEPSKYFITEAIINAPKTLQAYLELDEAELETPFNSISISSKMHIIINDHSKNQGFFYKLGKLLGNSSENVYTSCFSSKKIRVETSDPLPVIVDGEIITKTPLAIRLKPKALKIIVGRARI